MSARFNCFNWKRPRQVVFYACKLNTKRYLRSRQESIDYTPSVPSPKVRAHKERRSFSGSALSHSREFGGRALAMEHFSSSKAKTKSSRGTPYSEKWRASNPSRRGRWRWNGGSSYVTLPFLLLLRRWYTVTLWFSANSPWRDWIASRGSLLNTMLLPR